MRPYTLKTVDLAPEESGVYAWYYQPFIPDYDAKRVQAKLAATSPVPLEERRRIAKQLLHDHLFDPLRDTPYTVRLSGRLKAGYRGEVEHEHKISPTVLDRIIEHPTQLECLAKLLPQMSPIFASPLYIGMATNLRSRLAQHKKMLLKAEEHRTSHRQLNGESESYSDSPLTNDERDHSFAREVVLQRQISTGQLAVYCLPVGEQRRDDALNLEYIFNRIVFPICGRN